MGPSLGPQCGPPARVLGHDPESRGGFRPHPAPPSRQAGEEGSLPGGRLCACRALGVLLTGVAGFHGVFRNERLQFCPVLIHTKGPKDMTSRAGPDTRPDGHMVQARLTFSEAGRVPEGR